jgi:hypothetical protein
MKCKYCNQEIKEFNTIKIGNYEYEIKEHDFNLTFAKAKDLCPEGWELWTHQDCINLYNNKKTRKQLNLSTCWFYIINPFKNNYIARFYADSDRADLFCIRLPQYSNTALGVRFKRKLKDQK